MRPLRAAPTAMEDLLRALDQVAEGLVTVEAPGLTPDFGALESLPGETAWRWAPPDEPALVALGVARRVTTPAELPPGRKAFGAQTFDGASDGIWSPFGDAWFFLPRWEIRHGQLSVWLDRDAPRGRLAAEGARILAHIGSAPTPAPVVAWSEEADRGWWEQLVASALGAFAGGQLDKVVAARRARLSAASTLHAPSVASKLIAPGCTHYFLRVAGGPSFFGATPERLVSLRGRELRTEALAGTAPAGQEAALWASDKDRAEHQLVVTAIEAALRPLCRTLHIGAPEPKRLHHLVHLRTEVRGVLDADLDVLALVSRLHPTPATGGVPQAEALAFIAAHEPSRGLYAGPIGWFDSDGNGDFAVALRGALVDGHDAYLYAGAGLVAGSVAEREWAETGWKRRALCAAFGVEP